ncbi:MAG: hypothetical protein JXB50_00915 [Spirochaetes bacterium]|nr:hypothetical protein [Spirochaetota bacterium]
MFLNEILNRIKKQLNFNSNKNIFYKKSDNFFTLSDDTKKFIIENKHDIIDFFENYKSEALIDNLIKEVLKTFNNAYQFLDITSNDFTVLKDYYFQLLYNTYKFLKYNISDLDTIISHHYENLRKWLLTYKPHIKRMNPDNEKYTKTVVCYNYSPEFQINFFDFETDKLKQPILDIGCGYNALLVKHLRALDIEAYGIDVLLNDNHDYLISCSWLEYDYGSEKWGTIISHMAFSNHLINNYKRNDKNYFNYIKKFRDILKSLKKGGTFYYAPSFDLKDIDMDKNKYKVTSDSFYYKNLKISKSKIQRLGTVH